jgi:DNA uptake protein ComE-like DNA-binding protein
MKKLIAMLVALFLASALPAFAADKDAKAAPKAAAPAAAAKADDKVDINRAKAEELMKLDGIGDARAKAIIKGRPYKGKDDLVAKNIIPQAVYDKISDQIIAKQK